MMWSTNLVIAIFLSGLLGLERRAFLQAMISRPLVTGPLLGLILGNPLIGLTAGAMLELYFMGGVSLGSAIPDNEQICTVLTATCASFLANTTRLPPDAILAASLLAGFPAAKLGKMSDRLSERLNEWVLQKGCCQPDLGLRLRRNLYGVWLPFSAAAVACLLGALLGTYLLPLALENADSKIVESLQLSLLALLVLATAVAVKAVRTENALAYACITAIIVWSTLALGLL